MPRWACRATPARPSVPRSRRTRPACLFSRVKGFTTSYTSRPSASRLPAALHRARLPRLAQEAVFLPSAHLGRIAARQDGEVPVQEGHRRHPGLPPEVFDEALHTDLAPEVQQVFGIGVDGDDPGKLCAGTATPKALPSQKRRTLASLGSEGKSWAGSPRGPPHAMSPHERHPGRPPILRRGQLRPWAAASSRPSSSWAPPRSGDSGDCPDASGAAGASRRPRAWQSRREGGKLGGPQNRETPP